MDRLRTNMIRDTTNLSHLVLRGISISTIAAISQQSLPAAKEQIISKHPFLDDGPWSELANKLSFKSTYVYTNEPMHQAFTRTGLRDIWQLSHDWPRENII